MCKHRGGFPEGQSPIVLDTLGNAEYNIKYLKNKNKNKKKQFTIYYRSTLMIIHLCTNVITKLIIPNIKSRYSNNTHVRRNMSRIIAKI